MIGVIENMLQIRTLKYMHACMQITSFYKGLKHFKTLKHLNYDSRLLKYNQEFLLHVPSSIPIWSAKIPSATPEIILLFFDFIILLHPKVPYNGSENWTQCFTGFEFPSVSFLLYVAAYAFVIPLIFGRWGLWCQNLPWMGDSRDIHIVKPTFGMHIRVKE